MTDKEPYKWVTVKGKHIPVYKDEHGDDVFGNGVEEYKNSEEMAKRVVGENDPYFGEQYRNQLQKVEDLMSQKYKLNAELSDLNKKLKAESYQDEEDVQIEKMLGRNYAGMFKHYTERGKALQEEIKVFENQKTAIREQIEYEQMRLHQLNKQNLANQKNEWMQRIQKTSTMKEATKKDYAGFKLNESTTSSVDTALKTGHAKVVEMSPKEYIERANYEIFNKYTVAQNIAGRSIGRTNEYAEMMRQGIKFDTPYLDYENIGQEGIHRALAAIQNGYERIPVIVVPRKR